MNTIRSTWLGWGTLCVAGGGAYYFAKRQINADRAERYNKERQKQERLSRIEHSVPHYTTPPSKSHKSKADLDPHVVEHNAKGPDHVGSPSSEANQESAPVKHAPDDSDTRPKTRSKYEGEPFRSKKGDRFS